MNFTAKDVQALREKTGCGMMDCKKALTECDGDIDKAVDYLREKGIASQAKKSARVAAEGLVVAVSNDEAGLVLEVNSETDFVAGGDGFKALCENIANIALEQNPAGVDALLKCTKDGKTVEELVQEYFLVVRENMKVRRFARFDGVVANYVHAGGKIGVIAKFDTSAEIAASDDFKTMGKDVCMQIAALNPSYLNEETVPAEAVEHEKAIMVAQMKEDPKMANKPEQVLEKIVLGKMGKFFKENCLVNQEFVKDNTMNVQQYIDSVAKKLGGEIKIVGFERFEKGEGIEKREDNFADEVAGMIK
ncbi:MAG: translation elongation factor Ts [Acutalibacteraceae bacterium]|nr:translation elongation factor Ts [Acutalibacteraceae bacterium]